MHDRTGRCHFCDAFGSFQHIFLGVLNPGRQAFARPRLLTRSPDVLAGRWVINAREDARRLQHMGAICELIWANRSGRGERLDGGEEGPEARSA